MPPLQHATPLAPPPTSASALESEAESESAQPLPPPPASSSAAAAPHRARLAGHLRQATSAVAHHVKKHVGVGMICAVAYFDPGNWGVDLQAGSEFGYRLLFVVLLAGMFAVFLQVLATRLGCVTGVGPSSYVNVILASEMVFRDAPCIAILLVLLVLLWTVDGRQTGDDSDYVIMIHLASHTRLLLYNRPKHTLLYRWLGLYPLYVLAEVAIIATDLAELLGSAIALCMLFPRLELWHGVLITAFDVILILAMGDPLRGRPVRTFEVLIAAMVIAVLVCMVIVISRVDINWGDAFEGYVPSKYIFKSGGLYTSVGIIGATVMPHSLFIGSALATQDRIAFHSQSTVHGLSHPHHPHGLTHVDSKTPSEDSLPPSKPVSVSFGGLVLQRLRGVRNAVWRSVSAAFRKPPANVYSTAATRHSERTNNSYEFVQAHLSHGTVDVVGSLLGFAVVINSMILMLAAAVFFYGEGRTIGGESEGPASLFDAYDLIRDYVGQSAATLFAVALLAAGQSSSIIATVAGQAVCEGFLQWRVSPVVRRVLTRLLAIIPSMAVAIAVGRSGIDTLLVVSQVVLSIVLPFITFPLLWCTSSRAIMSVAKQQDVLGKAETRTAVDLALPHEANAGPSTMSGGDVEGSAKEEMVDYSNNKLVILIGSAIWLLVVAANMYVIVELGMGKGP